MEFDKLLRPVLSLVDQGLRDEFEESLLEEVLHRCEARRVIDVACGWGYHLKRLGGMFDVTGVDLDPVAVTYARERIDAPIHVMDWLSPSAEALEPPYDAVLCLGNSLPLLATRAQVREALGWFRSLVEPGGLVLIELRAFDRLAEAIIEGASLQGVNLPWICPRRLSGRVSGEELVTLRYEVEGFESFELDYLWLDERWMGDALDASGFVVDEVVANFGSRAFGEARSLLFIARRRGE